VKPDRWTYNEYARRIRNSDAASGYSFADHCPSASVNDEQSLENVRIRAHGVTPLRYANRSRARLRLDRQIATTTRDHAERSKTGRRGA